MSAKDTKGGLYTEIARILSWVLETRARITLVVLLALIFAGAWVGGKYFEGRKNDTVVADRLPPLPAYSPFYFCLVHPDELVQTDCLERAINARRKLREPTIAKVEPPTVPETPVEGQPGTRQQPQQKQIPPRANSVPKKPSDMSAKEKPSRCFDSIRTPCGGQDSPPASSGGSPSGLAIH